MNGVREYVGMRYLTKFADPIQWDNTRQYEHLTVVQYQGATYVSKQSVPIGVPITDTNYWLLWADFNAQLEQYRQEVQAFDGRITQAQGDATAAKDAADSAQGSADDALAILAGYAEGDTVKADISTLQTAIGNVDAKIGTLPEGTSSVVSALDDIDTAIGSINDELDDFEGTLDGFTPESTVLAYINTTAEGVVEFIDKAITKKLTSMSDKNFAVISRHINNTSYTTTQGFCIFKQNGVKYWAQSQLVSNSDGKIELYNLNTHALVGYVTGNFGHIHGMEYINGKLYVDGTVSGTAPAYSIINVENVATPSIVQGYTIISTAHVISRVCFINENEVLLLQPSDGKIFKLNLTDSSEELFCTLQDSALNNVVLQNFSYISDLDVFVFGCYQDNSVYVYNATNGNRLNVVRVPTLNYHSCIQEMEGACIHDGVLYVNGYEPSGSILLTTLLGYDFIHGSECNSLDIRPVVSTNGAYMRCDIEKNGSLIRPTQNHFLLPNDIINLMHFYGTNVPLRIHVVGSDYPYPIFLSNVKATLQFDDTITLHAPISCNEADILINGLAYVTFDGANAEQTYAVGSTGSKVFVMGKPTLSGTVTREIQCTYGSELIIPYNITFTDVSLNQSVAFVKNDDNFTTQNSIVIKVA